jgi:hypothetical protein
LDFIRNKYKDFPGFDTDAVRSEWEMLKRSLSEFLDRPSSIDLQETFWQQFMLLKESVNSRFLEENKNLLTLLSIYLIAPTNSVECERGVSCESNFPIMNDIFEKSSCFSFRQPIVSKRLAVHK